MQSEGKNFDLLADIEQRYTADSLRRTGHLIVPYKHIDGYTLDAHIFLPDFLSAEERRPVIAMLHGDSLFEGKPDWFFRACERYAQRGWVAVAVEYRLADRHDNLLPDAIAAGKSSVRFWRENAATYHIDPSKILVTGHSSGATIALAIATLDQRLDEPTENHAISSTPDAVIVVAGHHWWHKEYRPEAIEAVSPLHQLQTD